MPSVPFVPGVPLLSSYSTLTPVLLLADAVSFVRSIFPEWGIFRNFLPVLLVDSYVSFEFKQDFPVSDYKIEQGGFQTYNKVQLPADIRMSVATGGNVAFRAAMLATIDLVMNTTDLYDVVTPEKVYLNYNFTHRDFRRTAKNGLGLLVVDLWLTEIRTDASSLFQSVAIPGIAGQQGVGSVQPITPPASLGGGTSLPTVL